MAINKVLLLVTARNDYLFDMMQSLSRGFLQTGVDARLLYAEGSVGDLRDKIEALKPDAIFEVNRTRNQNRALVPDEVRHIAWLHDAWLNAGQKGGRILHRIDPDFGGSDLTYTLLKPEYFGLEHHLDTGIWGMLHSGVDTDYFHPGNTGTPPDNSACLCGYLPPPLETLDVENGLLASSRGRDVMVGEMCRHLIEDKQVNLRDFTYGDIHLLVNEELARRFEVPLPMRDFLLALGVSTETDGSVLQLFDTEIPRMIDRLALTRAAIRSGLDLSIYGPDYGWTDWPEFQPYYKGHLAWRQDLAHAYRSHRINLHNGAFGMHSRVLDAMGCGAAVFVNQTGFDDAETDIRKHFTASEHYIRYTFETLDDTLAEWKARPAALQEIGQNAVEEIRLRHTWRHRAEEILNDLEYAIAQA